MRSDSQAPFAMHHRPAPLSRLTPLLRLTLLACLVFTSTFASTSKAQQISARILQGDPTDDYEAVGIVGSLQRGGFCSGTLITDSHVLTAAHCAEVIESQTSGTFEVGGTIYGTTDVFIHPDYDSQTLANDIAILELSEPVIDVIPSNIFRDEPLVGDLLFIVGFGATGSADGGSDGTFGTKRVGVTTIDDITDTLVSWIFDDLSEANTAAGDSGGPGYIDIDGELFIACITSGGTEPDSSLGDFAFNTRIDAFASWIDDTIAFSTEPDENEPTDDGPHCDSFWSSLFDHDSLENFPVVQFLIDLLTALIDWLTDADAGDTGEAADAEGEEADATTVTVATPTADRELQIDSSAKSPDTTAGVVREEPETRATSADSPMASTTSTTPTGGGSESVGGVALPPPDATKTEIRRWMLQHPDLRDRVQDRL